MNLQYAHCLCLIRAVCQATDISSPCAEEKIVEVENNLTGGLTFAAFFGILALHFERLRALEMLSGVVQTKVSRLHVGNGGIMTMGGRDLVGPNVLIPSDGE